MEIISTCTHDVIERAAKALMEGHLVAFPTETVYGLGADATNEKAVSRIYAVKGRPTDHPLIVHIASINQLNKWATDIPEYAIKLTSEFWPGPMTLILKRGTLAKNFITGGQENIGLRIPNQPTSLALLNEFQKLGGLGIAAPSANRFGAVSPTNAEAVVDELSMFLGVEDLILDDGDCMVGVESTIIDCTREFPIVMRPGAITIEMIERVLGKKLEFSYRKSEVRTSGRLETHYAPRAKVAFGIHADPGDGFIALANFNTPHGAIRLASPINIEEFARTIYSALRLGDKKGLTKITVLLPNGAGLAVAIRDRLAKAAAVKKPSDRS
jgi:L-threonylcarbamoyladenylate synthase